MTSNRQAAHRGTGITLYKPAAVNWARHRKPNRRSLGWHVHTLLGEVVADYGEWFMRRR